MKIEKIILRLKTVKGKILVCVIPVIVLGMIMLMSLSLKSIQSNTISALEVSMHETATASATMIQIQLDSYKSLAIQLSSDALLTTVLPEISAENYEQEKSKVLAYVNDLKDLHGFGFLQIINENGIELETCWNSICYRTNPK